MSELRIAHIGPFFKERITGPKNSVTLLSDALSRCGLTRSDVFTLKENCEFLYNDILVKPISEFVINEYDVVVFPGVFGRDYYRIAKSLLRQRVPYIVSPRSSLMKEALRKSFFKKKIARSLWADSFVKNAAAIHFLTDEEEKNSININENVFLCGNGVMLQNISKSRRFESSPRIIGYLGRFDIIHKGLDMLIMGIQSSADKLRKNNYKVIFHGADFNGGYDYLKSTIQELKLDDITTVSGPLFGEAKYRFLASCNAFVHTSRYEGQPQAVMEALAMGTPVLVTPGTNMQQSVMDNQLGWACDATVGSIAKALAEVSACDSSAFELLSSNSLNYARANFSWDFIASKFRSSLSNFI